MTAQPSHSLAQSVHQRLIDKVRERKEDPNLVLVAISRVKDFYDIWMLSKQFPFEGASLSSAIGATFKRRGTAIPGSVPTALRDQFAADKVKGTQWTAFLRRSGLTDAPPDLHGVVHDLRAFLLEPLRAAAQGETLPKSWKPGGL